MLMMIMMMDRRTRGFPCDLSDRWQNGDDGDDDNDDIDYDDNDDDDDDGPQETWVPCDLSDRWRSQPSRSIAISEQSQLL